MGVEVLAVKLTGTYPCGTAAGAPSVITHGWGGGTACTCDPKAQFLNCQGVPSLEGHRHTPHLHGMGAGHGSGVELVEDPVS